MSNRFLRGFSYHDALKMVAALLTDSLSESDWSWKFDSRSPVSQGSADDGAKSSSRDVIVGSCGVDKGFFGRFIEVDEAVFVCFLVSARHELRHFDVYEMIRRGSCPDELLWAHAAKQGSRSYYLFNRTCFATEIDAEYRGVMGAYDDLVGLIDEECATELICDYVNAQCEKSSYYVDLSHGGRFETIDQIEDAFFDAYELSTSLDSVVRDAHGVPDVSKRYKQVRTGWFDDAAIAPLVSHGGIMRPECKPVFDAIWDAGNGVKDRMMASLAVRAMPELAAFYGSAACDDLSLQKVFVRDVANIVDRMFSTEKRDCRTPIEGVFFDDVTDDELQL